MENINNQFGGKTMQNTHNVKAKEKTTEQVISEMLTENTGKHFLDSGMSSNRHWQRNQARDFKKEPATYLSWKYGYMSLAHNIYHYLTERLHYSQKMQNLLDDFASKNEDMGYIELMESFPDYLETLGYEVHNENMQIDNSSNWENLLSQVIQFNYIDTGNATFVLLQIHGGCDIRGGYTAPKCFEISEIAELYDDNRCSIRCANEHSWTSYDAGYSFEPDDYYDVDVDWDNLVIDKTRDVAMCPVCSSDLFGDL